VRFEQALKAGEAAGGDLSGTYPNPSVARLVGRTVATTAPSNGQVLTWNGSVWEPGTLAAPASGIADNVPNTLVQRDATGGFAAQAVQLGQLRLIGGGGLLASGGFGTLVVPATGGGDRFMWYPGKSALRAGGVAGTEWDDQNIGVRSVAIGFRTTASGANSIALGALTTASNEEAVALGVQTTASGISATALGSLTTASGNDATAMGAHTTASGIAATAMGDGTTASGDFSTAMGFFATTNSQRGAFIYGDASQASFVQAAAPNSFSVRAQQVWFGRNGSPSASPAGYLTADGVIASTTGGFKFPDGTVQTSANAGGVTDHGMLTGLTDDDHLQYLLVDGVRASTDGFAVTGTIGAGRIPVSGSGTRLMWYPGKAAFRAGSTSNIVWDDFSIGSYSAALGLDTRANGEAATALGRGSQANGANSLAAGEFPQASGEAAVAMGRFAIASGVSATAFGDQSIASGNVSLAVGEHTEASGNLTTALGSMASTNGQVGSFVFGDATVPSVAEAVKVTAPNSFVIRAQRIWFGTQGDQVASQGRYIETSTGGYLSSGGSWTNSSDVNRKENFSHKDAEDVLETLSHLPIQTWNYKVESPSIRHLGPTAQDFYAAFHLGDSDKAIGTVDEGGVALLAIQALERRTRDLGALREHLGRLERDNERLRTEVGALRADLVQQLGARDSLAQGRKP